MSTKRRRRAQHAKSAKHPKHAKPLSASYHVTIRYARSRFYRGKTPTVRWQTGQKREAIRFLRRSIRYATIGTRGEVMTHEGQLLYQAYRAKSGQIIAEEL